MLITVAAAAVAESSCDSGGGNGNSNGWGGGIGSKGDSNCCSNDSNDGNNGGSCNSDGDDDGNDAGNDEDDGHYDVDTKVAAVRAAGATKTSKVTAMAGGTNNNQLKAQLCPAHNTTRTTRPGCALRWWRWQQYWYGRGERDGNGRGGSNGGSRRGRQWAGRATLCSLFFFSPIIILTITTTATEGKGNSAAAVISFADPFS